MPDSIAISQVALTGSAQQLTGVGGSSVAVKALAANAGTVYVGTSNAVSSTTGWPLAAGEGISLDLQNTRRLWVIGTAADRIALMGLG